MGPTGQIDELFWDMTYALGLRLRVFQKSKALGKLYGKQVQYSDLKKPSGPTGIVAQGI